MQSLMDLITGLRSARAEMNIDPKKPLNAHLVFTDPQVKNVVLSNAEKVTYMARLGKVKFCEELPPGHVLLKGVWRYGEFGIDLEGAIDYKIERDRIRKEIEKTKSEIDKIVRKINSHEFIARAPEEVVRENRTRHAELLERFEKLESNLDRLPPG